MPEPRLRTVARAALAQHRIQNGLSQAPSSKFKGASFIHSARDVQINDGNFTVIGGDVHHHYAAFQPQPTLAAVLRALPNSRKIQADSLSKATAGTGQGLLQSDRFQTWTNPTGNLETLWGRGKAGVGKTTLASIVINDLEARAKASKGQICVAYVYIRYTEAADVTIRNILEILVKQTVERHPSCLALTEELYDQHFQEDTQPTEGELLDLLAQFTRIVPVTFYIIDALDEAPTAIQPALIRTLSSLNIKLFITSRPLSALEASLAHVEVFEIIAQDHDLDLHIAKKIENSPDLQGILERGGPSLREEVVSSVKSKCDGMFLHASLQLDALQQCLSILDVQETLQNFPARIEHAYLQTWSRIMHQSSRHILMAKKVLLWVLNAPRSMTISELQHAVATHPETFEFERGRIVPETSLIPLCCGLITLDEKSRIVRLIHYTAKPTLEKVLHESIPHPHAPLATVCITHLTKCGFPTSSISSKLGLQEALGADPLLNYAHHSWAFHARQSLDDEALAESAKRFIQSCQSFPMFVPENGFDTFGPLHIAIAYRMPLSLIFPARIENPNPLSNARKFSPLALASLLGNSSVAVDLLAHLDIQINVADVDGLTELHYACTHDLKDVVEILLGRHDINVNAKSGNGWTPLMMASFYGGDEGCAKLLLGSPGIDVNAVSSDSQESALMQAADYGKEGIVELLLAAPDIQVNLVNKNGETALILAVMDGDKMTVRHLLAHPEVDVNHLIPAPEPGLCTFSALSIACMDGDEDMIQILLADPRINPHLRGPDGSTALLLAAGNGLDEIVNTLLASMPAGEVHRPCFHNSTPLLVAAEGGYSEIIKTLLAVPGADVNMADDDNDTALKIAASFGFEETVELLLEVPGIDINVKSNNDGHTAMSAALANGHERILERLEAFEARTSSSPQD